MKKLKSHFKFNTQERSGIFFLLLFIVFLQVGYFLFQSSPNDISVSSFSSDIGMQAKLDLLKRNALLKDSVRIYPFNPNFITDYKGYTLGMSAQEIDRLHAFRSKKKYANSPEEFQKVTLVSDSLLQVISPYFKFPEWTINRKPLIKEKRNVSSKAKKKTYDIIDLNSASAEELRLINGIGEKLSARIVKFRDRLGGFLVNEQLYDVYGLEHEVIVRTLKRFKVLDPPRIKKININTASVEMLSKLLYLQKDIAFEIVKLRNSKKKITSFDELLEIENFPASKIDRITLYLSL